MTQDTRDESVRTEVESIVREWFRTSSDEDFDAHNALIHPDDVVVYPDVLRRTGSERGPMPTLSQNPRSSAP